MNNFERQIKNREKSITGDGLNLNKTKYFVPEKETGAWLQSEAYSTELSTLKTEDLPSLYTNQTKQNCKSFLSRLQNLI